MDLPEKGGAPAELIAMGLHRGLLVGVTLSGDLQDVSDLTERSLEHTKARLSLFSLRLLYQGPVEPVPFTTSSMISMSNPVALSIRTTSSSTMDICSLELRSGRSAERSSGRSRF